MSVEIARYLICGTLAALITLGIRVAFSFVLPFGAAIFCAQLVGMIAGYWLYRRFVWPSSTRSIRSTVLPFIAVNLFSIAVVTLGAVALRAVLTRFYGQSQLLDLMAHSIGIVCGAGVSLVGHRTFTFR